jgi:hypothetical protein
MPFQQIAKLVHRHVTIAAHDAALTVTSKRNMQGLGSFVQAPSSLGGTIGPLTQRRSAEATAM